MYHYVYVLKSEKDGNNYVGYTADLKQRLSFHNDGKVHSTKNCLPVKPFVRKAKQNSHRPQTLQRRTIDFSKQDELVLRNYEALQNL